MHKETAQTFLFRDSGTFRQHPFSNVIFMRNLFYENILCGNAKYQMCRSHALMRLTSPTSTRHRPAAAAVKPALTK